MSVKGSWRRKTQVDRRLADLRWDYAFEKDEGKKKEIRAKIALVEEEIAENEQNSK